MNTKQFENGWSVINYGGESMNLTEKARACYVGRWQPCHNGHIALFKQKLDAGTPVLIMIRDLQPDERNPFTTEQTAAMLTKIFEGQDVKVMIIPDIESVNWGRGVGYECNEWIPPSEIGAVSATAIRTGIVENNDSWKSMVDEKIHTDVIEYLKVNGLLIK